jgi:acyl carrier protein phosphodiesterase
MNFLAHAYLSGDNEKLMVGNFIADFVKGKAALDSFEEPIQRGIYLHRAIDLFTDTHEIVRESKKKLREKYRHYAGVIVDVFYDHFLAKAWQDYHHKRLDTFADEVYATIDKHFLILPESVQQFFPYMVRGNWLVSYSKVEGIGRALTGMSRRTPYLSRMDEATNDLLKHYNEFQKEFSQFFPALDQHSRDWLENH